MEEDEAAVEVLVAEAASARAMHRRWASRSRTFRLCLERNLLSTPYVALCIHRKIRSQIGM